MDAQIIKQNGNSFNFEDFGVMVKDFIVSSMPIEPQYGEVEGTDRRVDYGSTYGVRTIKIPFMVRARDYHDYPLLRDLLFEKVLDKESYYIRERRRAKMLAYAFVDLNEPAKMDETTNNKFIGGKIYKVRLQNTFELEQMIFDGEGELVYETTELPFAESIGTTQDIQRDGIDINSELWGFGMGLELTDESLVYTHNAVEGETFRIYNAGNVPIHPFEQNLKITISNVQGSTDMFQITNSTNGSRARVNVSLRSADTVVYDGANVTRNNLAFLRDTRKDFIELSPGWNDFQIFFCNSATIAFDFPYYYK